MTSKAVSRAHSKNNTPLIENNCTSLETKVTIENGDRSRSLTLLSPMTVKLQKSVKINKFDCKHDLDEFFYGWNKIKKFCSFSNFDQYRIPKP